MESRDLRGVVLAGVAAIIGAVIGSVTSGYYANNTAKQTMYSEASFKLSSEVKQKASAYFKARERLESLSDYGELNRVAIVNALKEQDDALADMRPYFPMELLPSFNAVQNGSRMIYLGDGELTSEIEKKMVDGQLNITLAIHMFIENYDKAAQTSLANLDAWMLEKNKIYKRLFRPILHPDEETMREADRIVNPPK
jgi:hypothetical protein